ncbi:alanine racemase [Polymorphobacter fuscus]|uniref:DSD1 family PLP-dependent enzyme n=1 Tax=Sandarakinorhabdus fusca TaxID=1439888 RepID=A0A7C9KMI4_9SPHN|nr:alanine racemase [Polymorphobacter fuscus]KAB7645441.1 DSD1 family PLP-dependent enzyme [Polymorphobacter fuscus]MQT17863.1 DSD1 family PLP-dependent enzyme [Polymorphobacter fuscus]NJC08492.1 D-serine deaminase-like pyridoxal phosphate-dependent protein [Polymorphobacter fuscus]
MQPLADFLARVTPPQTPALVIRRAALDANLAAMQAACSAGGVRLRSHGKMHKCAALGQLQVAHGAIGLCCQTVGEAEIYAATGIADLMITAPTPPWGWPRLAALASATRISAVIDSHQQLANAVASGGRFDLFVDIDPGFHRAGVAIADAPALAAAIANAPNMRFGGIQGYAGHLQHAPNHDNGRAAANAAFTAQLRALVAELGAAGLPPPQVSGGGTGTYSLDIAGGVFTEIQAGSYALMDVDYTNAGAGEGEWPFQPALFLAATVVSANHVPLVTCDAGLKAFHSDGPPPRVVAGAAPGSRWRSMGDEHGAITHPGFADRLAAGESVASIDATSGRPADTPREGAIVWLQPGHVDPTVALHDAYWVADEAGHLQRWAIDARRTS